jgi:hypothetical protein
MSRKRYTREQVIGMLREAEVALAQGEKTVVVCRRLTDEITSSQIAPLPR